VRRAITSFVVALVLSGAATAPAIAQLRAQAPAGAVFDVSIPSGANYEKAEFRLWYPAGVDAVNGIVLLTPGSNGDGRAMANDTVWQQFAVTHKLALVASMLTDKKHDQSFIEDYVNVSHGSGDAVLSALLQFANASRHPELATAPLLLWGMSAGGQFNYEFVAWKPERVIAFVVNKGGIYYSALLSRAARSVPGLLFTGAKDLEFRTNTINGLFALNRRGGALWALAEEPGVAHVEGRSREVALVFFEDVLALRVHGGAPLAPLTEQSGFLGDLMGKTFRAMGTTPAPNYPTAWLPTERVAQAWEAMRTESPLRQP
jgi:poly(3-hydroxybutyrate) depolymerase